MAQPATSGDQGYWNVVHPKLRKPSRRQIYIFLKEREQYLLRIQDGQSSGHTLPVIPLYSSVDHDFLLSLICLRRFPGVDDFSQLTDDILLKYLRDKDEVRLELVSLEELESSIRISVKINVNEPDPELRIQALFTDYQSILRNKKWERLISDNPKMAIRHTMDLLKPAALKVNITQDLELGINGLKKNWLAFFEHVLQCALLFE